MRPFSWPPFNYRTAPLFDDRTSKVSAPPKLRYLVDSPIGFASYSIKQSNVTGCPIISQGAAIFKEPCIPWNVRISRRDDGCGHYCCCGGDDGSGGGGDRLASTAKSRASFLHIVTNNGMPSVVWRNQQKEGVVRD
jgi:hypothetical protein